MRTVEIVVSVNLALVVAVIGWWRHNTSAPLTKETTEMETFADVLHAVIDAVLSGEVADKAHAIIDQASGTRSPQPEEAPAEEAPTADPAPAAEEEAPPTPGG